MKQTECVTFVVRDVHRMLLFYSEMKMFEMFILLVEYHFSFDEQSFVQQNRKLQTLEHKINCIRCAQLLLYDT